MKTDKSPKKLLLKKETLRVLATIHLQRMDGAVQGAFPTQNTDPTSTTATTVSG
ncbi:MAG TPA: hypothetical protein VEU33_26030 [Archangium sp.]|nr:hypothetical protein [Archangium sp.]